jgi:phosphoglycolate phosphatase
VVLSENNSRTCVLSHGSFLQTPFACGETGGKVHAVIRNVILDWSGTLVDDLPAVWQASNHTFRLAGARELTLDEFRLEFCLPFKDFYDRFTPGVPMAQLEEWYHHHFKLAQDSVAELPHAREFLLFCREHRLRTFLLSTIHRDHFAVQAAQTGFDQFIERPYVEVLDKRTRIREILDENQLHPRETVFIGDMRHDVETAKHGGVFSCAVLTGYNRLKELRESEPDIIVEHLGEFRSLLLDGGFVLPSRAASSQSPGPVPTVGALVFNARGEVLMIRTQKWSDLWGIPGGKIKQGESSVEALRREIREETDLEIADIEFALVQDCIHSKEFYRDAHFILLNYVCRCVSEPEVRLNEEAQEFRWVPMCDALELELNQPTRILLEHVCRRKLVPGRRTENRHA